MQVSNYLNNGDKAEDELVKRARLAFEALKRRYGGNDGGVSPYPMINPKSPKPNQGGGVPVVKTKKPELA